MFEGMEIYFSYFTSEKEKKTAVFKESYTHSDFEAKITFDGGDGVQRLGLIILPCTELQVDKLYICCSHTFKKSDRIFANGYQSWTESREFKPVGRMKGITWLAVPVLKKYQLKKYGDYTFHRYTRKKGTFHSYTYTYIRNDNQLELIGSLSERNGFTVIESHCRKRKVIIRKDCKGLFIQDAYAAFDLIWAKGTEDSVFDAWFDRMGVKKPGCKPMTGWTSWYNYYQNINEEIILENLNNIHAAENKIDIFQIDDGYQCAVGDWLKVDSSKFPNGMKAIADAVKSKGYKAGIWLAPFVCETNSEIFREKKEWLLKDSKGAPVPAGSNWSGFYALDFGNPEVKDYIRSVFSVVFDQWGYDMVKLDFLYAVCLISGKYKTRGQIMAEAMEFLRECAGNKLILGCGVPLGSSFGLVDYCRIGCDISLDWNDKLYMRFLFRERVSTLNAIRDAIGRKHLNGRAFLNDPDVFLLRDDNIKLTEAQKLTLFTVNYIFGSLLFTSDNTGKYDSGKWSVFNNLGNLEAKRVTRVEYLTKSLVEVVYYDRDEKCLALINLGKKRAIYDGCFGIIREATFGRADDTGMKSGKIRLEPYESRIFVLS